MSDTLDQAVAFLEPAAKPAPGATAPARVRVPWGRIVKIGLATTLLGGAAVALLIGQGQVTADNAVVSAYVLSVRSPIQGQLSGLRVHVGDTVADGAPLARVVNDRVDDERLIDLRSELARTTAQRAAHEAQKQRLTDLRDELTARSIDFRAAQTAYAAAFSREAEEQLVSGALRLELARREMTRKVTLGRSGDAPTVDVDLATFGARTAEADVRSQAAHLASLRAREAAVARGVFLDAGSNDVSYSIQRTDDINVRLAEVNRALADLDAAQMAAEMRLAAEERRFKMQSEADLDLSASGMVWKLGASNGERIGSGDTLAQVVDCAASFIVAAIPQRQFSSVEVGSVARFRLSGETIERTGRILSVTGDSSVTVDRNLAATPAADPATTAMVRIEMPASANNGAACLVGRTARVLMPRTGSGVMAWLRQQLP